MSPSYIKSLNNPVISQLFSEASREIRVTQKIIFIGYALSDADVHIKALFKKHLKDDVKLVVVNIKNTATLKQQYHALSDSVEFIHHSFEEIVQDDGMMQKLLT